MKTVQVKEKVQSKKQRQYQEEGLLKLHKYNFVIMQSGYFTWYSRMDYIDVAH